ncbi:MAG: glycosyltransferase, partial [Nanoarchaeota archaeon]|nr:glycosyltransferase [Nanoarchaeota archaeon]
MNKIILSVVIPSYKDPLLKKTINDLLKNSELNDDELEIVAVLDGYWVKSEDIVNDKRVKYIHLGKNRGMRGAINAGVLLSKGEYLMRADEHQMFGKGYDKILTGCCEDNWIVTPRRYCLDVEKWEIMEDIPPVDFAVLKIGKAGKNKDFEDHPGENEYIEKFSGVAKPGLDGLLIQESMAMQGSCWLMKRSW